MPSPALKFFFKTFISPVTSTTGFKDTNSISITSAAFGGTAGNSSSATLPVSPNASVDDYDCRVSVWLN